MAKAATKSITEVLDPKGVARAAQEAERAIFADAFCALESPIAALRLAALIAERAADAIDESNDQIEMATYAARHVAEVAQQLEELWTSFHNEACDAGHNAAAD
jgi:hypothetical protein